MESKTDWSDHSLFAIENAIQYTSKQILILENSIKLDKESFLRSIDRKKMRMFPEEKFSEYTAP